MSSEKERARKEQEARLKRLNGFDHGYTAEKLLADLVVYFDGEVDFDREKIKEFMETPNVLENLVVLAKKNQTHPVVEFIRDMLRGSADGFSLGKIET